MMYTQPDSTETDEEFLRALEALGRELEQELNAQWEEELRRHLDEMMDAELYADLAEQFSREDAEE